MNNTLGDFASAKTVRYVKPVEGSETARDYLDIGAEYPVDRYDDSLMMKFILGGPVVNIKVREEKPQLWSITEKDLDCFEIVDMENEINLDIFEEYPKGTVLRYLGGDRIADEHGLVEGQQFEVTDHDDLGDMGKVVGFSMSGRDDDFYALSYGEGIFPDNRRYFEKVK